MPGREPGRICAPPSTTERWAGTMLGVTAQIVSQEMKLFEVACRLQLSCCGTRQVIVIAINSPKKMRNHQSR